MSARSPRGRSKETSYIGVDDETSDVSYTTFPIGIVDSRGEEIYKKISDKGDGNFVNKKHPNLIELDVERDVQFSKWGLTVLMAVFAGTFMYFLDEFKDLRNSLTELKVAVAVQNSAITSAQKDIDDLELKPKPEK